MTQRPLPCALVRLLFSLAIVLATTFLPACGSDDSSENSSLAPPEAQVKEAVIRRTLPPQGFSSAVVWIQGLQDRTKQEPGTVEVDWYRIFGQKGNDEILVSESRTQWGGLYLREPWFKDDIHDSLNANQMITPQGTVLFDVSEAKDRVWHFGGARPASLPAGIDQIFARVRVRLSGPVLFQAGLDYWKNDRIDWCGPEQCNKEAAVSDWFTGSGEWMVINIGK